MKRILTGLKSTGVPHIGNYFGMIKQTIDLQKEKQNECLYFIADLHSFTTIKDSKTFKERQERCVIDWLALGVDPEISTFYRQSDIMEHSEAYWLMMCQTPLGMLERAHAYKDAKAKGLDVNAGLLSYPILMAMDILLYDAEIVPVGKDQKQHVEMARDLAQKFNHEYGDTFILPEPRILKDVATVPGLDGAKMSKSYGNTIEIFGTEKEIKKKIMSIKTESKELGEPLDPETCNVMAFHRLFNNPNLPKLEEDYRKGSIGFGESKKQLFGLIWEYFAEARERREKLEKNPDYIAEVLQKGAQKAKTIANKKLQDMRAKMGLGPHL